MTLAGTRPPTVDEWDKYELHHRARLATKPGLTGMWQVSGRSNITDFEEVVKLDKQFKELQDGFDMNKAYLFHGKTLIDKERRVLLPSFFTSREITDKLAKNIKNKGTQILVGSGCSGKTLGIF